MSDSADSHVTEDVSLEYSPLARDVEREGVRVKIRIFRGEADPGWLLEVEDHEGGSTVWNDPFETDQAALDEALRTIEEDGIEGFAQATNDPRCERAAWAFKAELPPLAELKRTLDTSPEMLSFQATCGVFVAVATAPEMVAPSTWLHIIKGEHVFADMAEVQHFTGGLMSLYSEVLQSVVDHGACCCPDPSDHEAVHLFCRGYLSLALGDATWEADERAYMRLLPMLALADLISMDKLAELPSFTAGDPEAWLQDARDGLQNNVTALYEYWADDRKVMAERLAQHATPIRKQGTKVGRNDPCPCGSGKKSKKCCAT